MTPLRVTAIWGCPVKPCRGIAPDRGQGSAAGLRDGTEPPDACATYRRCDGRAPLGQNVIPDGVGDAREVLADVG